jgi:hypothetical protein
MDKLNKQKWFVRYAEQRLGDKMSYVVTNGAERLPFVHKSDAIAESQRRNGWPVDGSEDTYADQTMFAREN